MRSATSAFGTASTGAPRTNEDLEALRGLLLAQRSRGSYYRDADLLGLELPSVSTQASKPRTHSSTRTPRRLAPDHYQSTRKTRLPRTQTESRCGGQQIDGRGTATIAPMINERRR